MNREGAKDAKQSRSSCRSRCRRPTQSFLRVFAVQHLLLSCGAPSRPAAPVVASCGGDLVVNTAADAAAAGRCRAVGGALTIGPSFDLTSVAALGRVEDVKGSLEVSENLALGGVYLAALAHVGGDVTIEGDSIAGTVSLHHLVEIAGDLRVRDDRALQRLDLTALRRVGGQVEISGNPVLDTVVLDRLERAAGGLVVEDDPAWPADQVAALRARVTRTER